MALPLVYAAGAIVARFIAKKGLTAALKKFTKKAISEGKKHAKDMVTKKSPGQAKVVKPVKGQRQYRKGTRVAAVGTAVGVGVPSALAIAKLRTNVKKAKTETARVQAQKDVDNAVAKVVVAEEKAKNNSSVIKKSLRPQTRKTLAPSKSQRPKIRSDK